jgi:hypothetical protein
MTSAMIVLSWTLFFVGVAPRIGLFSFTIASAVLALVDLVLLILTVCVEPGSYVCSALRYDMPVCGAAVYARVT